MTRRAMKIKAAAVRVDRKVYTLPPPGRHNDVLRLIWEVTGKRVPNHKEQGFVTECGRFLNRKQAGVVARRAGQIDELQWPHMGLNSEDLW